MCEHNVNLNSSYFALLIAFVDIIPYAPSFLKCFFLWMVFSQDSIPPTIPPAAHKRNVEIIRPKPPKFPGLAIPERMISRTK